MFADAVSHICVAGLVVIFVTLQSFIDTASAGVCWATKQANGKCVDVRRTRISREECCALSGFTYWSEEDLDSGRIFYYQHLVGGYPQCSSCTQTCQGVQCPDGKRCRMRSGTPRCVCAPNCSNNAIPQRGPVCGTNTRSFRSHCSLLRYNCRHEADVKVSYYGRCQVGSCDQVECARPGHQCLLDQNSVPHCIRCITDCPRNNNPALRMCGVDGVTYESACHAAATACREGRGIPIAYPGACIESATCSSITCSIGRTCLMNQATSRPQCVDCDSRCPRDRRRYDLPQLCGMDGETYRDWCQIRDASCRVGRVIETRHVGTCEQPLRDQGFVDSSSTEV